MRRFLSTVLYLVLGLPIALSGLFALSLRPWAFDKTFYSRAIDDPRLWIALRSPSASARVAAKVEIGGYIFSGPALYRAVQKHLPEAELKSFASTSIDSIFGAVDSGATATSLDLRPIKAALKRDSAAIANDYIAALPAGDVASLPTDLSVKPPNTTGKDLATREGQVIVSIVSAIPDEIKPDINGAITAPGGRISAKASLDRLASSGVAAAAVLLLGLGFLGGGSLGASLARTGRYIILPSTLVLVAGIALSIPAAPLVLDLAAHTQAAADLGFLKTLGGWLGSWLGVAARSFFVVGLSGLSLGALLASIRRILEPREY